MSGSFSGQKSLGILANVEMLGSGDCSSEQCLDVTVRFQLDVRENFQVTGFVKPCASLPPEGGVITVHVVWKTELEPLISISSLKVQGKRVMNVRVLEIGKIIGDLIFF